ncbi:hypothetical protein MTO96_003603 [Rhipicephalus appendiculatus]
MEVVVEGQTITEDEYLSGSWTTLEAQRWCARQQPRTDTDTKQTGSTTADSEHRERGRPRFRARPPPLPKRKPLPKLLLADYKIIIRPQTAASLLRYGATELFKAVCAAAQVNPAEVVAEDQLRLHPTNNTALISTPSLDRAGRYIKLQVVKIGQQEIQVFAYAPAPENSTKGILYHACSDEDDTAILNELRARNKCIAIVGARRLGKSRHIVTIFAGADRPDYVRYWGATYVVYPFRDRIEACYNCRKVGHRTDVCPQERKARCKRCGDETHATPEWGTKPTCTARCIVCKGGHPTGGRNCKFKYYSQVQQHNNSKNGTGTKDTTVVIAQQQGSDQENTTRITSATQPNSQSTGYRDAVRGTPLTEASQARQDKATLLQQAPSGSREHSSSRGRAAAHGHYTSHGHGTSQGQGAGPSDPGGAASETLLQDAAEVTTEEPTEEDGPRPDAKLIKLLENQQALQAEWLKRKHDRQLKLALAQAETEVQKYSQELRSAQWMQLCNRLNGQIGSKNPWFLFRHLLDPDNSKGTTKRTKIAKETRNKLIIQPLPKNMGEHNKERRRARADALWKTLADKPAAYVDASPIGGDKYAIAAVEGTGRILSTEEITATSILEAEEAAIAMATAIEGTLFIVSDSMSAIRSFRRPLSDCGVAVRFVGYAGRNPPDQTTA